MYLSLFPLPRTFNLCSLELIFFIFKVATSQILSPQQKDKSSQHLCSKFSSLFTIVRNCSLEIIVGYLFLTLEVGSNILDIFLSKQTR